MCALMSKIILSTAAMLAEQYAEGRPRDIGVWDSGAFPIVLDSGAALTPVFANLINPRPYEASLTGVGQGTITHVGRVQYEVRDDNGSTQLLIDDEAYYGPSVPYQLLCPHSWRTQMLERCDDSGDSEGAGTYFGSDPHQHDAYVLSWNNGGLSITVPLDHEVNLPIIYGNNSYAQFTAFAAGFSTFPATINDDDSLPIPEALPFPTADTIVTDSEDSDTESQSQEGEASHQNFATPENDASTSLDKDHKLFMS